MSEKVIGFSHPGGTSEEEQDKEPPPELISLISKIDEQHAQ